MRGAGPAGSPGRSQRTASLPRGGGYSRLGPHVLKKDRTGGAAAKTRAERHDTAREERAVRVQARGPHEGEPRLAASCGARRFRGLPDALASAAGRRNLWAIRRPRLALRVTVCGENAIGVRCCPMDRRARAQNGAGQTAYTKVLPRHRRDVTVFGEVDAGIVAYR